ncbi:MAG: DUF1178 family protein [Ottowia sp.]|nr:DUF1178 family protein [Ottowia sp.]
MKVLNLRCTHGHGFEGWFSSEEDFLGQQERGLLSCPICGSADVARLPSAPHLNLGAQPPEQGGEARGQAAWLHMVREVLAHTEDVGERFAEEARRIHYGEVEQRGIRGQATAEQTEELLDEGIPVLPLPLPPGFAGTLQ